MNRNYMVLCPKRMRNDKYTIRMISGNHIPGLLPFQEKRIDGECWYYYDVTSKQPLSRILEYRNMRGEELKIFLSSLLFSVRQMERFLLDENQICLDPDYLYMEPEGFQCALVLIPGRYEDFVQDFRNLAQYLLDHVDQNDRDAVVLAFSVFKESRKINFGIEDIEKSLGSASLEQEIAGSKAGHEKNEEKESRIEIENEMIANRVMVSEDDRENLPEREGSRRNYMDFLWIPLIGVMLFIPVFVLGMTGIYGFLRWKWYICIGELMLSVIAFIMYKILNKQKIHEIMEEEPEKEIEKELNWEEYLRREENFETGLLEGKTDVCEEMQTMLLTSQAYLAGTRSLVPVDGGKEIALPYFPFLIGKNEGITDYCLERQGVSRIHVKLEEKDGGYQVTDLNSTNGTKVNGRLLNANESCVLPIGGELTIAAERFIFR